MPPAASSSEQEGGCAYCGLPVRGGPAVARGRVFCCHGCRLVAQIVGAGQGENGWNLLRLGIGTLLSMNIMMISLLLYTGSNEPGTTQLFRLVLLALSTPALAILLPPFLAGAGREWRSGRTSLDTLIACGSLTAYLVSAYDTLSASGDIYFDTATMLPVLVTFGKLIEACAKGRAADLLHGLESLLPESALRVTSGAQLEVAIDTLRPGDLVRVRPGERIAVDGIVVEGTGGIEEAAFTGEFLPRLCRPGDRVTAGTVNGAAPLLVRAEKTGSELLLHGIVALIEAAWRNPSGAERMAERAARLFIPVLFLVAAGSLSCWTLAGNPAKGLMSALCVLVVACPCTIGIATPLATSLAIARAARAGIVVRGGAVMERIAQTELIFFDKTGTVTTGQPVVREILCLDPQVEERELLGRLAVLQSAGGHPLGRAIEREARLRGCGSGSVQAVRVRPGSGLSGTVTWQGSARRVTAGSGNFVAEFLDTVPGKGAPTREGTPQTQGGEPDDGSSLVYVAWDGRLRGRLQIADSDRGDAGRCLQALSAQGICSVLLSGDRYPAAAAVAGRLGIGRVEAPRNPAEKLQAVADGSAAGRMVAMVGDGVNDAPALAAAQTGIAFGSGMDLAKQAGNVVILSDRLLQIPWLIGLSRQTRRIVHGNFAWSFGYNALAIAAAAAGMLHPLLAALAMVFSSLTVLGNSLRIGAFPDDPAPGR